MKYEKQLMREKITLLEEALRELDEETSKLEEKVKNIYTPYKNKFVRTCIHLEYFSGYISDVYIYNKRLVLTGIFINCSNKQTTIVDKLHYKVKDIPLTNPCISEIPKDDLLNKVNNSLIKTLFDILCHEN